MAKKLFAQEFFICVVNKPGHYFVMLMNLCSEVSIVVLQSTGNYSLKNQIVCNVMILHLFHIAFETS